MLNYVINKSVGGGGAEKGYKKRYKKNMCEKIIINV